MLEAEVGGTRFHKSVHTTEAVCQCVSVLLWFDRPLGLHAKFQSVRIFIYLLLLFYLPSLSSSPIITTPSTSSSPLLTFHLFINFHLFRSSLWLIHLTSWPSLAPWPVHYSPWHFISCAHVMATVKSCHGDGLFPGTHPWRQSERGIWQLCPGFLPREEDSGRAGLSNRWAVLIFNNNDRLHWLLSLLNRKALNSNLDIKFCCDFHHMQLLTLHLSEMSCALPPMTPSPSTGRLRMSSASPLTSCSTPSTPGRRTSSVSYLCTHSQTFTLSHISISNNVMSHLFSINMLS